jgi:hypothetical protein
MKPNLDQVLAIVRWLLSVGGPLGAYLVSRGIPAEQVTGLQEALIALLGTVPPIATFIWTLFAHTDTAKVISASTIPGTTVVTSAALAAATPAQTNIVSNTTNEVKQK